MEALDMRSRSKKDVSPGRFGTVTPYRAYMLRMRWLLGLLLALVVVLVVARVSMLSKSGRTDSADIDSVVTPNVSVANAVSAAPSPVAVKKVLVTKRLIPQGSQIVAEMFDEKDTPVELVPIGALLSEERNEVRLKYAKEDIPGGTYVTRTVLSDQQPINPFYIPPGYRAMTITVDARSGVEGFAKPDTKVDVLWLHRDTTGTPQIMTIVRFAQVLSVGGQTETTQAGAGGTTTATLLVTERQAKMIELARETGKITLSLVGEDETKLGGEDDVVSLYDILRVQAKSLDDRPDIKGKLSVTDPSTGKKVQFLLSENSWELKNESSAAAETEKSDWLLKNGRTQLKR